tara:strand:- start:92 stop:544 length:453 start_codon:yes stop_codon:yes gene_type:complete
MSQSYPIKLDRFFYQTLLFTVFAVIGLLFLQVEEPLPHGRARLAILKISGFVFSFLAIASVFRLAIRFDNKLTLDNECIRWDAGRSATSIKWGEIKAVTMYPELGVVEFKKVGHSPLQGPEHLELRDFKIDSEDFKSELRSFYTGRITCE